MVAFCAHAVNDRVAIRENYYAAGGPFVVIRVDYNNDGIAKLTRCLILLPLPHNHNRTAKQLRQMNQNIFVYVVCSADPPTAGVALYG